MERADFEESAGYAAVAFAGVADLVGVTGQGDAGGAWFIRHRLADRGHDRGDDGQGKHPDDEYCSQFWFHYCDTDAPCRLNHFHLITETRRMPGSGLGVWAVHPFNSE